MADLRLAPRDERPHCAGRSRIRLRFAPEKGSGYIGATIENIESLGLPDGHRAAIYEGEVRRLTGL